eukprot:Skav203123  [mRNA]  locus=scaffold447:765916:766807:- [translate_table: standard]
MGDARSVRSVRSFLRWVVVTVVLVAVFNGSDQSVGASGETMSSDLGFFGLRNEEKRRAKEAEIEAKRLAAEEKEKEKERKKEEEEKEKEEEAAEKRKHEEEAQEEKRKLKLGSVVYTVGLFD